MLSKGMEALSQNCSSIIKVSVQKMVLCLLHKYVNHNLKTLSHAFMEDQEFTVVVGLDGALLNFFISHCH